MARLGREFEKLVARIEQKLCPLGAKVTSPDRIPELVSGNLREVDASIRYQLGSAPILITVECRERNAVQDVTWLEQVKAKKDNIGANQTIAVSKEGFSDGARLYAKQHGIVLRQLAEVTDAFILQCMSGTHVYTRSIRCHMKSYNIGYFPEPEDAGVIELHLSESAQRAIDNEIPFAEIDGESVTLQGLYQDALPEMKERILNHVDDTVGFNSSPWLEDDGEVDAYFEPKTLSVETIRGMRFINVIVFGVHYEVKTEVLEPLQPLRYTDEHGKHIDSFSTTTDTNNTMRVNIKFGWDA